MIVQDKIHISREKTSEKDPGSLHPVLQNILKSRGLEDDRSVLDFLNPDLWLIRSPFLLKGMKEAVFRFKTALEKKENIGVFCDSDVDGVTSLAVLMMVLEGRTNVPIRYPEGREGYGLTDDIIRWFSEKGIQLLVTLDSGIRDLEEIRLARELGMDVIVLDHHVCGEELPDAMIVNPACEGSGYPFPSLSGVGVTFKFCHALMLSYLPIFNLRYAFVTGNGNPVLRIIEGLVESEPAEFESLSRLLAAGVITPETRVIATGLAEEEERVLAERSVYTTMTEFLEPLFPSSAPGRLRDLARSLDLKGTEILPPEELMVRLFHRVLLAASPRISEFLDDALPLVALGTIADVMPLKDENRVLVRQGLDRLDRFREGELASYLKGSSSREEAVAWKIAPLLNTPGRFGETSLLVRYFLSDPKGEELHLEEISALNTRRRTLMKEMLDSENGEKDPLLVREHENCVVGRMMDQPEGLSGLVAGRLAERYGKPAIVAACYPESNEVRGSARSPDRTDCFSVAMLFEERFIRIGGHAQAFGFTIEKEQFDSLCSLIDDALGHPREENSVESIVFDLSPDQVTLGFLEQLDWLRPFGKENDAPLFLGRRVAVRSFRRMGDDGKHGIYQFHGNVPARAIGWNRADQMHEAFLQGEPLDLVYRLEINEYRGNREPRMIIEDIRI
jgi:single-stranded-DNA-specific exonuclease